MSSTLSRAETWSLLTLSAACVGVLVKTYQDDGEPLFASLALGLAAFAASYAMIVWLGDAFIAVGRKGTDMSKKHKVEIPETMGAVCGVVYIFAIIIFIPFAFRRDIVAATSGGGSKDAVLNVEHVETGRILHRFPLSKLSSYAYALISVALIYILGIADDIFDMRWRHKVFIPAFASIPMLLFYYVDFGVTQVVVPILLRPYFGELLNLGSLYYAYMAAVTIFAPNSINILAGINGIEVGQSIVIGILILLNSSLYILPLSSTTTSPPNQATMDVHLFTIYLLLPFLGVSLALLKHNWYPARVFVGDTYCYFAGMVFAVVGILGHFSKTLLLLFLPQIANFIYSAPQLFHIIPCPRHRLPRFNARTGLLEPSVTTHPPEKPLRKPLVPVLELLHALHLLEVKKDESGRIISSTNLTLLNLWLVWRGPRREDRLAIEILSMQMCVGLLGLWVRHRLALLVFTQDNRAVGGSHV
ncbi:tunicamycin resistance protein [Elasticomyces elasticus]|nr:tunicamycin resistance protein [Elasticomyces elasticus]